MIYRNRLKLAGSRLKVDGTSFKVPPWKSSDNDGSTNPQNFMASRITNGYFNGYNPKRLGKTSLGGYAGRATTYMETGHANVAIEGVFEGNQKISGWPTVCVTPAEWEHDLSPFAEQWTNPETGEGFWVIWYISRLWDKQAIPVTADFAPGFVATPGVPITCRVEVVGRRMRAFYNGNNDTGMELIIPVNMAGSTKHGVTHDILLPYMETSQATFNSGNWNAGSGAFPDSSTIARGHWFTVTTGGTVDGVSFVQNDKLLCLTDFGQATYTNNWLKYLAADTIPKWIANTYAGQTEGMEESSWSYTSITHFSDEAAGTLGSEILLHTDFLQDAVWTKENGDWTIDTDIVEGGDRPFALASKTQSAGDITTGYLRQTFTALTQGDTYRVTFGIASLGTSALADHGFGTVTARIFDGTYPNAETTPVSVCGGHTFDIVATGPHTTIEILVHGELNGGFYKINKRVHYVSLRKFTAT